MATIFQEHQAAFDKQAAYFTAQRESFSLKERKALLKSIAKWVTSHTADIQAAIYADFRKPAPEVDLTEVKPITDEIDHTISHLNEWAAKESVGASLATFGTQAWMEYQPKGVCLIIAPWNFPFMLAIKPLVSALAAGCTAVVKPSEMTPNTAALISKMCAELFDDGRVVVFEGGVEVSQSLLELPWHHIFFTGSPQVGKIVMQAAAKNLTDVTLELGGVNPVIVDSSADLNDAVTKLTWGDFMNAGQSCMSPNVIYVHKDLYSLFLSKIDETISKMYGSNTDEIAESGNIACVVNEKHLARLRKLIDESVDAGASIMRGGEIIEEHNFLAPTVLRDVPPSAPVNTEEVFGPVMCVAKYENLDDLLAQINARPRPLAVYVFSKKQAIIDKVLSSTVSGTACINDTTLPFIHPNLPFGGVNTSGIGRSHGKAGFLAFSNQRSVVKQRRGITTTKLIYPPYKKQTKQTIDLVVKYL